MHDDRPIFLFAPTQRSGTNFVAQLLCLHPDVALPAPLYEDYLLAHAGHLVRFVEDVSSHWDTKNWGRLDASDRARFEQAIGTGLVAFLNNYRRSNRILTKTPWSDNLQLFHRFFPKSPLIFVVRDGRDVVESSVVTFKRGYDKEMQRWVKQAGLLRAYLQSEAARESVPLLLCYEDLVADPRDSIEKMLDKCDLDATNYPWDKVETLPVVGSSETAREGGGVHWKPRSRDQNFNPVARWWSWPEDLKQTFWEVAGPEMEFFGYSKEGS